MAGIRRLVKVFLASPGDLAEERKAAKHIVDEFNNQLAEPFGYQVDLVGWEDTLPGVGRPQAIINRDLDGCDLFVGMLWKRWGTPPGTESFTSGFEEEFNRSMARNTNEGRPEINLLLKDLDAATLADPGDHLKKVLTFREKIFGEKKLLAGTFSDIRDFEGKFRRCIQGYVIGLTNKNQADASEKEQAPITDSQTIKASESGTTTPLSKEGARFLREFVETAEKATEENPFLAEQVARLRLLSNIAAVHGNDEQPLGSHDANLLFKARIKFNYGRREHIGLVLDGLDHFKHENVPIWYWLAAVGGFKRSMLPVYSVVGPPNRRVGALKAMRLISEQIEEEERFGRKEIITTWFSDDSESAVKVSALEYLAECGHHSDLPHINEEFAKNDTQTANPAADAIICITLRDDRRAALEALYTLQPSVVKQGLLADLFNRDAEFDDEILLRGLGHRSSSVRVTVIKLLRKRHALVASVVEPLLNDSDADVRYEALQALVTSGRSYSVEQAKAVLVRKSGNILSRGLLGLGQQDADGEAFLERYKLQYFDALTDAQLEEEDISATLDQNAYFALIRRHFKSRGEDLRRAVGDRFVARFDALLDRLAKRFSGQVQILEDTRSLGAHLRKEFTRQGLDIICNKLDPADLSLVRSTLAAGEINYSSADLEYLAKFGHWCDIPLVIKSLERPERGRKYATFLSIETSTKYEDAARTLYALGKNRMGDLFTTPMPGPLLACLIQLIPDSVFQRLTDSMVSPLMHSDNEKVRKIASLKYVRAFPRRRVTQFLEQYIMGDQFYYNVIHWFDFGNSVPSARMAPAVRKAIAEA